MIEVNKCWLNKIKSSSTLWLGIGCFHGLLINKRRLTFFARIERKLIEFREIRNLGELHTKLANLVNLSSFSRVQSKESLPQRSIADQVDQEKKRLIIRNDLIRISTSGTSLVMDYCKRGTNPFERRQMSPGCIYVPGSSQTLRFTEPVLSAILHVLTSCPSFVVFGLPVNGIRYNVGWSTMRTTYRRPRRWRWC